MQYDNLLCRIEKYVNSGNTTEYAVLLHGEWGCGKTFFCKKLENELSSDLVWYISVFGVTRKDELDEKIFEASHPIISSKSGKTITKLGFNISKIILKSKFNIDLNVIMAGVSDNLKNIENLQCKLLVVDDLERSKMDIDELFGYFSSYLYDGLKIIFVANENEVLNKKLEAYSKYKEKIIGENYEIIPNVEEVIEEFNKTFNLPGKYVKCAVDVCEKLGIKNLRLAKQVLYQWRALAEELNPLYKKDDELIFTLYKTYIVLKMQYKLSVNLFVLPNADEIQKRKYFKTSCQEAWLAFKLYDISLERYRKCIKDESSEMSKNRVVDLIIHSLFLEECWYEMLVSGKEIDTSWLNDIINNLYKNRLKKSESKKRENTNLISLNRLIFDNQVDTMNNINIKCKIENLCEDFKNGMYIDFGECVSFIRIYLYLLMEEIVPKNEYSIEKLNRILDNYIEKFHDSIHINSDYVYDNLRFPQFDGSEEVQERIKRLYEIVNEKNEIAKNSVFHEKEKFFSLISIPINSLNKYLDIPIMKQMDIDKLFIWLDTDENVEYNNRLLTFLQYRYGYGISNRGIGKVDFDDYDSVMKLKDEYKNMYEKMKCTYSLKIMYYKYYVAKYEDLLKYMNDSMKEYNMIFETRENE